MYRTEKYAFDPQKYEIELLGIFNEISRTKTWDNASLRKAQTKFPKNKNKVFSKNDLVKGYEYFVNTGKLAGSRELLDKIKMKPMRTLSGVAPVTVLTKPWPCPGKCIYCPNEENMPKSYISSEPGAQRAVSLNFDPYLQTSLRIQSLEKIGHNAEKVELIVLGGSWSAYPENYRKWFIKRCFEAMNDMDGSENQNKNIKRAEESETSWEELEEQQKKNEKATHRCVGLSLETRPDLISCEEVINLRKYGATKIQLGVQSLNNRILRLNLRGHTQEDTKQAFELLRLGGFKIHAHWMVNLYGSSLKKEIKDFKKLWTKDFCPDDLKIYPTEIIPNTKLAELWREGKYKAYETFELIELIAKMKLLVPYFCRITRIVRDIPAQEIAGGNKVSNLRQDIREYLSKKGKTCGCIRCREIKDLEVREEDLILKVNKYATSGSREYFLSFVTAKNKIAGFLRLSLPYKKKTKNHFIPELRNSAIIREVHVYGEIVGVGKESAGRAQHLGLGKRLLEKAEQIAQKNKMNLAVISAIGTREYYANRGFEMKSGDLYMHKKLF